MEQRAVAYLLTTSAGTLYTAGHSHYSVNFADVGIQTAITLALLAFATNPVGVQDKNTSVHILRAATALKAKLVVHLHWDVWTLTLGHPNTILAL